MLPHMQRARCRPITIVLIDVVVKHTGLASHRVVSNHVIHYMCSSRAATKAACSKVDPIPNGRFKSVSVGDHNICVAFNCLLFYKEAYHLRQPHMKLHMHTARQLMVS